MFWVSILFCVDNSDLNPIIWRYRTKGPADSSTIYHTVRTFLVVSHIRGWITISIDFSNAFVQSYLPKDEPVWMENVQSYMENVQKRCGKRTRDFNFLTCSILQRRMAPLYHHLLEIRRSPWSRRRPHQRTIVSEEKIKFSQQLE